MFKKIMGCILAITLIIGLSGCSSQKDKVVKIGVSMGVGAATRWDSEAQFMKDQAAVLGAEIEVRLNRTDQPLTQEEDCKELIDSGIDVLILTPRDVNNVDEIVEYAKNKNVKVISYARSALNADIDLYVGYDSTKIGQLLGQYISELVYQGDYIILKGDANDYNATLINDGAMKYIDEIRDNINVILETEIAGWDPAVAKEKVKEAVANNGNKVDAIFAPNDKLAGASLEALQELGVETPVIITGMDAELSALQRIVAGTQCVTIYMDLRELANTAINEAIHMAKGEKVNSNGKFQNIDGSSVDANLIVGNLVTNKNIDKQIIEKGVFTKEEVYGTKE